MIRRFGERIVPGQYYKPRPGAYAILPRNGALLVTHQAKPFPEFQLPGGGIDPGESPIQALHREVFEETGWLIAAPRKIGSYRRFVYMPEYDLWAEKVGHVYLARPVLQKSGPLEPGHIAVWMSPKEATQQLGTESDRHFISQFV
jgi:8-oxo-dGTP diphosphatase